MRRHAASEGLLIDMHYLLEFMRRNSCSDYPTAARSDVGGSVLPSSGRALSLADLKLPACAQLVMSRVATATDAFHESNIIGRFGQSRTCSG